MFDKVLYTSLVDMFPCRFSRFDILDLLFFTLFGSEANLGPSQTSRWGLSDMTKQLSAVNSCCKALQSTALRFRGWNTGPLKMKNAFYVFLKALFVLKILEFLPWLFGDVKKQLD